MKRKGSRASVGSVHAMADGKYASDFSKLSATQVQEARARCEASLETVLRTFGNTLHSWLHATSRRADRSITDDAPVVSLRAPAPQFYQLPRAPSTRRCRKPIG